MRRVVVAAILSVCTYHAALASVYTSASCVGDSIEVRVRLDYAAFYHVAGLNLEWTMVGQCEGRTAVPGEPVPVAATDDEQDIVIRVPVPVRDRILRYHTVFTDANGNRVAAADPGCSWFSDYAVCGEGMALRARLFDFGTGLIVDLCDDQCWSNCWGSGFDLRLVESTWRQFVNTGRLVNVYGDLGQAEHPPCSMPSQYCLAVTRLEFENDPSGCSAVADEARAWGAVKSLYR